MLQPDSIVNRVNKEKLSCIKQWKVPADWEQRLGHAETCSIVNSVNKENLPLSSNGRGQPNGNRGSAMLQPDHKGSEDYQ
jgi:hypothetical protein